MFKYLVILYTLLTVSSANAVDFDIKSVRVTLSKPNTSHTLFSTSNTQETLFNLTPTNNERIGVFVDINDIEIGYAIDPFKSDTQTKTQNFIVSYRKLKNSRISLNYQTLEGLNTFSENQRGAGAERQFLAQTTSTKWELFGIHNLYTFGESESLFEHFFLNRPVLSNKFDWSISIVGGWSFKHLSLENERSIIFNPNFLEETLADVKKLDSNSLNADIGPFLSLNFPLNINFFAEYKFGRGYINNLNEENGLKESGDEKSSAFGLGLSWTSDDKKTVVLLRGWEQKARHIKTSFGDLSIVKYF